MQILCPQHYVIEEPVINCRGGVVVCGAFKTVGGQVKLYPYKKGEIILAMLKGGGVASRTSPHPRSRPPDSAHAHWVSFQSLTGFPSCFDFDFSIIVKWIANYRYLPLYSTINMIPTTLRYSPLLPVSKKKRVEIEDVWPIRRLRIRQATPRMRRLSRCDRGHKRISLSPHCLETEQLFKKK